VRIRNLLFSMIAATVLITGVGSSKAQASDNGVLGLLIGGAAGGYIGSNVGKGRGQLAATAVGALLGAAIGNEMGESRYRAQPARTVYNPPPRRQTVYVGRSYEPPRRQRVYAARTYEPPRHVVVHKHKVIVKHVYVPAEKQRNRKHWKRNDRRQQRADACDNHPRRCARGF